jgi:hypothetical protein
MRRGLWSWAPEGLESRCLLAATIYTVNLTTDNGPAAGQGTGTYTGDLRYCINLANANKNTADSEIQFDPKVFASPQTITLSSTLVLSETAGLEVIDGPGANLVTVSGNNAVEVFSVARGVTASFTGLTISGGSTVDGGGGIGNGIDSTTTVTNCTIAHNHSDAQHGQGGAASPTRAR